MVRKLVFYFTVFFCVLCLLVASTAADAAVKKKKKSDRLTWDIRQYYKGFLQLTKSGSNKSITFKLRENYDYQVRKVLGKPETRKWVGNTEVVTYYVGHLPLGKYPEEYFSPMMKVTIQYAEDGMVSGIETELEKEKLIRVKAGQWVMSK